MGPIYAHPTLWGNLEDIAFNQDKLLMAANEPAIHLAVRGIAVEDKALEVVIVGVFIAPC
jgi:hypothetical protein